MYNTNIRTHKRYNKVKIDVLTEFHEESGRGEKILHFENEQRKNARELIFTSFERELYVRGW